MRALLINPWIYDFAAYDLWSKPLGLLTLGAHLRAQGAGIDLLDCLDRYHPALEPLITPSPDDHRHGSGVYHAEEIPKPPVFAKIPRRYKRYGLPYAVVAGVLEKTPRPDVVLLTSGMTYWYPAVQDMIALIRRIFPGVAVLLGGNYANLAHEHALRASGADLVFRGTDPGKAAAAVEAAVDERLPLPPPAAPLLPAYDLYRHLPYVTLKTSHGCPFKCSYCAWHLVDPAFSRQEPAFVVEGIAHFHRRRGVEDFAFYDDALLWKADEHFLRIAEGVAREGIKARFHTPNGLHNRFLSPAVARAMKRTGFVYPRLAWETISRQRQLETGNKTTDEEFYHALENLLGAGYRREEVGANILIGLPDQSPGEIEGSIRAAAAAGVHIHLEEYSPVPGTPEYLRAGLAQDADPLLHNNSAFPLIDPAGYRAIQRLKRMAHDHNAGSRASLRSRGDGGSVRHAGLVLP